MCSPLLLEELPKLVQLTFKMVALLLQLGDLLLTLRRLILVALFHLLEQFSPPLVGRLLRALILRFSRGQLFVLHFELFNLEGKLVDSRLVRTHALLVRVEYLFQLCPFSLDVVVFESHVLILVVELLVCVPVLLYLDKHLG